MIWSFSLAIHSLLQPCQMTQGTTRSKYATSYQSLTDSCSYILNKQMRNIRETFCCFPAVSNLLMCAEPLCFPCRVSVWWSLAICTSTWACCCGAAGWCCWPSRACVRPTCPCSWWPSPWPPNCCWQRNLKIEVSSFTCTWLTLNKFLKELKDLFKSWCSARYFHSQTC